MYMCVLRTLGWYLSPFPHVSSLGLHSLKSALVLSKYHTKVWVEKDL